MDEVENCASKTEVETEKEYVDGIIPACALRPRKYHITGQSAQNPLSLEGQSLPSSLDSNYLSINLNKFFHSPMLSITVVKAQLNAHSIDFLIMRWTFRGYHASILAP
ncbi:hypothetical protein ACTXT7_016417 [Hymenolepis weldensis]